MAEEIICSKCGKVTDKMEQYCVHCGYYHQLDHYESRPVKTTGLLSAKEAYKGRAINTSGSRGSNAWCECVIIIIGLVAILIFMMFFWIQK